MNLFNLRLSGLMTRRVAMRYTRFTTVSPKFHAVVVQAHSLCGFSLYILFKRESRDLKWQVNDMPPSKGEGITITWYCSSPRNKYYSASFSYMQATWDTRRPHNRHCQFTSERSLRLCARECVYPCTRAIRNTYTYTCVHVHVNATYSVVRKCERYRWSNSIPIPPEYQMTGEWQLILNASSPAPSYVIEGIYRA